MCFVCDWGYHPKHEGKSCTAYQRETEVMLRFASIRRRIFLLDQECKLDLLRQARNPLTSHSPLKTIPPETMQHILEFVWNKPAACSVCNPEDATMVACANARAKAIERQAGISLSKDCFATSGNTIVLPLATPSLNLRTVSYQQLRAAAVLSAGWQVQRIPATLEQKKHHKIRPHRSAYYITAAFTVPEPRTATVRKQPPLGDGDRPYPHKKARSH